MDKVEEPTKDEQIANLEREVRILKGDVQYWKEETQSARAFIRQVQQQTKSLREYAVSFGPIHIPKVGPIHISKEGKEK